MWIFFILADCLFVFLFVFRTVILCLILLFLGAVFLAGGGEGDPVLQISGFLRVVSLDGATLVK